MDYLIRPALAFASLRPPRVGGGKFLHGAGYHPSRFAHRDGYPSKSNDSTTAFAMTLTVTRRSIAWLRRKL